MVADKRYYFFFQEDGSAFTDGYKEITLDGKLCYFYFLANGQGFNTGYKTAMIDGKKHFFYFGDNAQAITDTLQAIPLGDRTAYMLFKEDARAYTEGYKEIKNGSATDYYYFLSNGQAFTTGYKTAKIDGTTYYFFFQDNGKAFTGGLKAVPFGTASYYYYFQQNGRALTADWTTVNNAKYYFQANGRAAQNAFQILSEKIYYFNNDCTLVTGGWFCVGDGYYHAGDDGVLSTDTVVEGYKLDAAGKSTTKYRIIQLAKQHTNDSMSNQQKIAALYNWILYSNMTYIRTYEHTKADWVWKDSWVDDMAASLMDNWGGNCYRYAAFLGMLIREATGLPVAVYHGSTPGATVRYTPHGWPAVYQDGAWYVYDVELQKFSGYSAAKCYKAPAAGSYIHVDGVGTNLY